MKFKLLILFISISFSTFSQDSAKTKELLLEGYVDSYFANYSGDFNGEFQPFTTTSPRNNQIGLNIAQIKASYKDDNIRGSLGLHYGDIASATWSSEFNEIQEANVGVRIWKSLWLDAGFFTTHIGTESFLPKNNWTTSTAVATFNEPFYQAGAKLSYQINTKLYSELWLVNGYNQFIDINSAQSMGILINYDLSENTTVTYTNLLGRESIDGNVLKQYRTYHNLYINTILSDKIEFLVGGDLGTQTNSDLKDNSKSATMYNALIAARFSLNEKLFLTSRLELFKDPEGFISGTSLNTSGVPSGLELYGATLSLEYKPSPISFLRFESRLLQPTNNSTLDNLSNSTSRIEVMCNLGIVIDKKIRW